jgi:chaperonin GroES
VRRDPESARKKSFDQENREWAVPGAGGQPQREGEARIVDTMAETRPDKSGARDHSIEVVEPIGKRVLIRKDEDKKVTKGGVHLPDKIEIPTLTGRVVTVSAEIARNEDYPIQQYDRVLFNPKHAIPVDFEGDNRLFVVPIEDVVAVFRKS